ncbi:MAG: hypothetical protein COX81_02475 [Candidatus Magasanikbacteria bacterium CG_4_10_14_0_2_um_filter_37_12]|uniref:ISL3 family transposase n=1 Tax=Candidatus Magasanikbacteria bacterium CG_4_10_14_0_2_um_filter_37_12 TaxID=1974637 RepID=A0A2M7V7S7_9BACT|nr:MAG: hypothetical protein COX81_02475 [Candidatus Magasanikbacteria bacterium CG_4_10_14_0_2_um_filter_37_12]
MVQDLNGHYKLLLGLSEPWKIETVDLSIDSSEVTITVAYPKSVTVVCPGCGMATSIYDYRKNRSWRHLDTMQFKTIITCATPRSNCDTCGIKTISVPWANKGSGFTLLFEYFAISVITHTSSITAATKLLNLNWHQIQSIMARAVVRGLEKRDGTDTIEYIGIDEKSFLKKHTYISNLYDLDKGRILDVVEGRKKEHAQALLNTIEPDVRGWVKAVAKVSKAWAIKEAFGQFWTYLYPKSIEFKPIYAILNTINV